jgi:hypothetical protein
VTSAELKGHCPIPFLDRIANGCDRDLCDRKFWWESPVRRRAHEKVLLASSGVAQSPQPSSSTHFIVTPPTPIATEIAEKLCFLFSAS